MKIPFPACGDAAIPPVLAQWSASPGSVFFPIAGIFLLLLLSGVFVAAGFALQRIRSAQLEPALEKGDRRAKVGKAILERTSLFLCVAQLGATLCTLLLGWWGGTMLSHLLEPLFRLIGIPGPGVTHGLSIFLAFCVIAYLHIVFSEIVPRAFVARHPVAVFLASARPLSFLQTALAPICWALAASVDRFCQKVLRLQPLDENDFAQSEEKIRSILLEQDENGDQPASVGQEILRNALDLKHRVVCDIMTPRGEVIYLDLEEAFDEEINKAIESRHTRFPLCKGHIDEAMGLVHIKDVLALVREGKKDFLSVKRELFHVPEMMPLEKLLRFFLTKKAHLAMAVDEYGGAVGIVTLDNVIEEIVGTIHDEFDAGEEDPVRKLGEDEFDVDGGMPLHELSELLDMELESPEASTIGGFITAELGHIPRQGESLPVGSFLATVSEGDQRRVLRVHFKKQTAPGEHEKN